MIYLLAPLLPALLALAAIEDARAYLIPNWISALVAILGVAAILASGMPVSAAAAQIGMGAAGFALGFALFAVGVWGGGDGKLVAATALWFDPSAALAFAVYTVLAGGAVGLVGLALHFFRPLIWRVAAFRALPLEKLNAHTPYGVAIAIGAIAAFPSTLIFKIAFG